MASVLGSFAFSFFKWTSAFNLYDYMLTDPLAFFFNCTAILLILRRRQFSFFLVCLLGLFNKISMVGVIPCYLLRDLLERKLKISSVVSAVSVIMIYLVFRTNMPAPVKTYSLITVFTGIPRWQSLVVLNLSVFGILTFFTVSRMWLSKFTLSLAPLAMMSLISTLFICDKERGIIYAFPLVLISVLGIRMETRKGRILTIAPIFTYFLVEIIQERLHIRAKPLFFIEFGIFVVLEAAFLCEYFKDNPKFKAIIAQVNSVRKGGRHKSAALN